MAKDAATFQTTTQEPTRPLSARLFDAALLVGTVGFVLVIAAAWGAHLLGVGPTWKPAPPHMSADYPHPHQ